MDGPKGGSHPSGQVDQIVLGQRTAVLTQHVDQSASLQQLHHQVGGSVVLEHLEDPYDAGVGEASQHPGFSHEPLPGDLEGGLVGAGNLDIRAASPRRLGKQLLEGHAPL